jgi:cold shock CspA family protein
MQATVATFDAATGSGTLLSDDGSEMPYPAAAFEASGLRLLRIGQRVTCELGADGSVVRLVLPGIEGSEPVGLHFPPPSIG